MAWIFQGNPKKFAIDDYVARYPELIYWRTPRYGAEIRVGDRAFLWRSGADSGAIAIGTVIEDPTRGTTVRHPEALGVDLWRAEKPDPDELKTGIRLDEVRLTPEEGMLARNVVATQPIFKRSTIIRMPNGTVFKLNVEELAALERMWGVGLSPAGVPFEGISEGDRRLRSHYKRERSVKLRATKLEQFLSEHSRHFCELCGDDGVSRYPRTYQIRMFEVHHRKPLASATEPIRTTLEDLALLCANCHRLVHATKDVDKNYSMLVDHFRK